MTFSRIAVLGANGQVGRALVEQLGGRAIALTREQADLSQPETLPEILDAYAPDAIINAAAYTAVDKAETDMDTAFLVNAVAPGVLAHYCAEKNIPLVHYSTDYVYDGSGEKPWRETDAPAPLGVYGHTKLIGDQAVASADGQFLIFRISWVYDTTDKNFFTTMLRLGAERDTLSVVADQHGAPCYAPHLAEATLSCLEKAASMRPFPSGIYHLCHQGETTWHGFAEAIFKAAREQGMPLLVKTVEPTTSEAYPTPAIRPRNSRMDCTKLRETFDISLPDWQEGLAAAMEARGAGD